MSALVNSPLPLSSRLRRLRPLETPSPPSFEILQRTVRRVIDRFDVPVTRPERDIENLLADMIRRIRESDWHKVPMSFVTRVASIVFSAVYRVRDDLEEIRFFLIKEIGFSTRPGFLNPMMRIYIESYEPGAKHTAELATALKSSRKRIGARWEELLLNVPQLLDSNRAHEEIADLMSQMEDPWHGLRSLGLRQPHGPGLMDAAHLAFIKIISKRLNDRSQIERLFAWLKPDEHTRRQVGAGQAINALLNLWSQQDPPKDIKELLIDRITDLYGHPRVNRNVVWNEVDTLNERMFLRWLMGADIRFLFKILTDVERKHMWADREDFWWTLYQQGRIDEVWIAFNSDGYDAAMNKLPADSRQHGRRFAKQVGEKDKSLLIMRIGQQIIVEGTYNFMIRAFDVRQKNAPKLYESKYDVANIRRLNALWEQKHQGRWQDNVLRML